MFATAAATREYFQRLKEKGLQVRTSRLGSTDLTVSRVGFGCYRVHEFEPDHRDALRQALLSGVNLIDTSTNYTDGSAERLVGDITRELFDSEQIQREEIVIVTKIGYVQGSNLKEARERASNGNAFPEMVEFQSDCWHNISPVFLENQITRSLERLKMDTIDVLLLHNPEYYLKAGGSRDAYYARIEKAFQHLELEVDRGRIRAYGISSNTFPEPESRSDFTSLTRVYEIAKQVSPKNHFAVIQLPFNVYEAGAVLHKNNDRKSVLEFAKEHDLGVLGNRPFNAFAKGRLVRLTSYPTHDDVEVKGGLHTTLGRAIELEKKAPGYPKAPQGLQWAHALRDRLSEIDDLLSWRDALFGQIYPSIRQAISRLGSEHGAWVNDYQLAVQELLRLVTWDLENLANQKSTLIGEQLQNLVPDLSTSPTLSRKVLRLYQSFPEVSSVLVGMRTPAYVTDALGAEGLIDAAKAEDTLTRLQRYRS